MNYNHSLPSHYNPMGTSSEYHDPIYYDESGCYITAPQLRFFINRDGGRSKFINGSTEFREYFRSCKTYNLISDMMDEDATCGKMYWDEDFNTVVFSFPVGGVVAKKFMEKGLLSSDDSPDDLYPI